MNFKLALNIDCGIRFMFDNLDLKSSCARSYLLNMQMMTTKKEIDNYYSKLNLIYDKDCSLISSKLECLKDIHNTIKNLSNGAALDDIELFEIKYLSIISLQVREIMRNKRIDVVNIPSLEEVLSILDPDGLKIPSFYVYDSYSKELAKVRKEIRNINFNNSASVDDSLLISLQQRNLELENDIRRELSHKLISFARDLEHTLNNLSLLDILIAKSVQMKRLGLAFPVVVEQGECFYNGMFNPEVKSIVEGEGKEYCLVDIAFDYNKPVTLIGANMGGKSVVLKTLALNQLLVQFGFGVAALNCCVSLVSNVLLSIGDDQSVKRGVSSFAAEILSINDIIGKLEKGEVVLALVDEPARTTNPVEGTALVEGLIKYVCSICNGGFVLTTHYNIKNENIKRYRVKGLVDGKMNYSLMEVRGGEVPHEAIAIAESLNVNENWIKLTKENLNN